MTRVEMLLLAPHLQERDSEAYGWELDEYYLLGAAALIGSNDFATAAAMLKAAGEEEWPFSRHIWMPRANQPILNGTQEYRSILMLLAVLLRIRQGQLDEACTLLLRWWQPICQLIDIRDDALLANRLLPEIVQPLLPMLDPTHLAHQAVCSLAAALAVETRGPHHRLSLQLDQHQSHQPSDMSGATASGFQALRHSTNFEREA